MDKRIILFVLAFAFALVALAQEGLEINTFFSDEVLSRPGVTSVNMKGDKLKDWTADISMYRSIQIKNDPNEANLIERAVKTDGLQATSRTVSMTGGHIYFGYYALPAKDGINRYIILIRSRNPDNPETIDDRRTTLFYIEGKATPAEFKRMLNSLTKNR